ncbi:MAG: hypothetical protein ACI4NE_06180 [Succinivibrio sp.]
MSENNLAEILNAPAVNQRDFYNVACFLHDHEGEQSYARYFDIRNINPKHCFEYLKIDNPNLDILMKAFELKEPETIEELSHVLFVLYKYYFEWHNEDEYVEIANKHPEVLEYARKKLENHEYQLDDEENFIEPVFLKMHDLDIVTEYLNEFALPWLVDEVVDKIFSKNHFKMMNYKQEVQI